MLMRSLAQIAKDDKKIQNYILHSYPSQDQRAINKRKQDLEIENYKYSLRRIALKRGLV